MSQQSLGKIITDILKSIAIVFIIAIIGGILGAILLFLFHISLALFIIGIIFYLIVIGIRYLKTHL